MNDSKQKNIYEWFKPFHEWKATEEIHSGCYDQAKH